MCLCVYVFSCIGIADDVSHLKVLTGGLFLAGSGRAFTRLEGGHGAAGEK